MTTRRGKDNSKAQLARVAGLANKRLVAAGFSLSKFIKASMGSSGATGTASAATKGARRANRSSPGEPPHVDTGLLRASVSVNWTDGPERGRVGPKAKPENGVSAPDTPLTVRVGHRTVYGVWLEFGTTNMAARPHLVRGFDMHLPHIKRIVQTGETANARRAVQEEKESAKTR